MVADSTTDSALNSVSQSQNSQPSSLTSTANQPWVWRNSLFIYKTWEHILLWFLSFYKLNWWFSLCMTCWPSVPPLLLFPVRILVPVYWALSLCRPALHRRAPTAMPKWWAAAACWTGRCPSRSPPMAWRWEHKHAWCVNVAVTASRSWFQAVPPAARCRDLLPLSHRSLTRWAEKLVYTRWEQLTGVRAAGSEPELTQWYHHCSMDKDKYKTSGLKSD